jgi:hypothetical protein
VVRQAEQHTHGNQWRAPKRADDCRREQHRHALDLLFIPHRDQPAGVLEDLCLGCARYSIVIFRSLPTRTWRSKARGKPDRSSGLMSLSVPKLTCQIIKQMSDVGGEADIKNLSHHFR